MSAKSKYPWFIKADGSQSFPQPANGIDFSLKEIQGFVGGKFEILKVPKAADPKHDLIMLANERGRLIGLSPNAVASMLVGEMIVGDVLVCHVRQLR
jgi:hypothetical protein